MKSFPKNPLRVLFLVLFIGIIMLRGGDVLAISFQDPDLHLPNPGEMVLTSEKDIPKFIWVAGKYLQAGKFQDVISICEQVLSLQTGQVKARAYMAAAYKGMGDENKFNIEAGLIKKQAPDSSALYLALAHMYPSQNDFKKAEAYYKQGLQKATAKVELRMGLASLYKKEGRLKEAENQYMEVLTDKNIAPKHFLNANFALCRIELQKKEYDQVIKRAKMVTDLYPPIPRGYMFLAYGYLAKGETDQAIKVYKRLMAVNPESPVSYQELALLYSDKLDDQNSALSYAKKAVQRFPKDAKSQDILGWVYYNKSKYKEALKGFQEAVYLAQSNPQYHYHLGLAHLDLGEKSRARDAFTLALNLLDSNASEEFAAEIKNGIDQCK